MNTWFNNYVSDARLPIGVNDDMLYAKNHIVWESS